MENQLSLRRWLVNAEYLMSDLHGHIESLRDQEVEFGARDYDSFLAMHQNLKNMAGGVENICKQMIEVDPSLKQRRILCHDQTYTTFILPE